MNLGAEYKRTRNNHFIYHGKTRLQKPNRYLPLVNRGFDEVSLTRAAELQGAQAWLCAAYSDFIPARDNPTDRKELLSA